MILAVENDPDRLWALVENLRRAFPDDTVEYTHDPLMAGRYIYNKPVDMLFAQMHMKRLDGLELCAVVRQKFPDIKVYLILSQGESRAKVASLADGLLSWPVTVEALRGIAGRRENGRTLVGEHLI